MNWAAIVFLCYLDLNRITRRLAVQRQRDWDDDVFNAAVGFDLTMAQRQERLARLRQTWEGRQVPATVYPQLVTLRAQLTARRTLPATWPATLTQTFQQRLAQQPTTGWVPARKNHVTPRQLRQLVHGGDDLVTVTTAYHRLYALPAATEAVTLSALHQYYLRVRDQQKGRSTATQQLVEQLLKSQD